MKEARLVIRVNLEDKALIMNKVSMLDVSLSEFVRTHLLDLKPRKKREKPKINPELFYQLNKIGINLNQIAKSCNQYSIINKIDLLLALNSINEELKLIREKL